MRSLARRVALALVLLAAVVVPAAGQVPDQPGRVQPSYPGSLPFFYDLYTFRGTGGRTLVVAAVAVAARWLERRDVGGREAYRFDLSFVLADTAVRSVFRTDDTVSVAAPRPLPGDHLLHTQVAVEAPPSTSTVQRVVMTDPNEVGVGQLYDSAFPIPDYTGSGLMLSDVALGQRSPRGGLNRGGHSVAILPLARFPEKSLDLYYEIYNLPAAEPYTTEITFQPIDDAGRAVDDAVGVRFHDRAPPSRDATVRDLRSIAADLRPGLYRLTVVVRAGRGTARRSREFEVRPSGPGTSLVIALPRR